MYIKETTAKERLIIAGAVGDALLTSDTSFCGLEPHMQGAAQAVKSMRVHNLNHALFELERKLKPAQREEICRKRRDILRLPDDQAALALEAQK
ncbi:hypothetical protein D1159_03160 [Pseudoflavonifractor sp. 524-17]|uniref:hypothetical protein n=1 Tax=Pseudoflavonifractor sp. 524-17 TaxID=2304577 RepID=UPI0013795F16|nr:hypothetical protein [Pseudoflavonifractor sp. 524-17]NCE63600.1 hypothetical protein [Pseudoflavonifractor sp. 524-17]